MTRKNLSRYIHCRFYIALLAMSLLGCNDPEEPPFANLEQAVTEVASGLSNPWGLAFLPDGRALVTERFGALRILNTNGTLSAPLAGVPEVFAVFQGGMLDVAVDDNFENNNLVYLSYSEPGDNNTAGTALGRGILQDNALLDFQILFRENPKRPGGTHFGSRILFDEGYLFLTLSDRNHTSAAQDLSNHQGTIVRIWPDGTVPLDNPYANDSGAMPEIWSYGHRNVQGAAINPVNGDFWISEMGPQGGDEINKVLPASNYGWPLVSWGDEYGGAPIPNPDTRPDLQDAALWWSPSVAPSGVEFYTGSMFSQWQGRLLVAGLQARGIVVVGIEGNTAVEQERLELDTRIRDVKQAPDGSLYLLTDENPGRILRVHVK